MPAASHIETYSQLSPAERHLAHLCALAGEALSPDALASLSRQTGWSDRKGNRMTQAAVRTSVSKLVRKEVLRKASYRDVLINPDIQDLAVQDSIREDWFGKLASHLQDKYPRSSYSYQTARITRDLRIAFYDGDVETFKSLVSNSTSPSRPASMLDPFSRDLYDRLDPILQEMYLIDVVPQMIVQGDGCRDALNAFETLVESHTTPSDDLVACAIDVHLAGGQLEALRALDQRTGNKLMEIAGCDAFLRGDFRRAETCFATAMPIGKRGAKKSKTAQKHLPGLLYLLLLFKKNCPEARAQASSLIGSIAKSRGGRYLQTLDVFQAALSFQQSPSSPHIFAGTVKQLANSSLASLLAGYVWNWLLTEDDVKFGIAGLAQMSTSYKQLGMSWLAAELAGLAGKTSLKSAANLAETCDQMHGQLGTQSLVDAVRAAPIWERALNAIGQLGVGEPRAESSPTAQTDERMIWELTYSTRHNEIDLRPFVQKRKGNGWTKGRKVGLQRLYEQHNDPEFAFLTDQDTALCRCLQSDTDRNYYGYNETTYYFDDARVVRAIVGHPCIFREGDRDQPVEIVEQEPHLMVSKTKDKRIALSLNPSPPDQDRDDEQEFRILEEGPQCLAMVFFNRQHLMLDDILGGQLFVPESAASHVMDSIQSVASLVAVHSEIGSSGGQTGETVSAESRPHLHLLPYHAGLQLKFYVRPFGSEGPFFRPGDGAETVVAKIGGQTKTSHRDLKEEIKQQADVVAACPAIAAQADDETICFPSATEALETLLDLEDMVADDKLVLHWPQGRSLQLAGQASGSQFRVKIRKDRDWFAASGELKVDKSLSLDLMRLIELVEASPSRFVELDDGRFLALTEQLARRIEDLAAYGERGKSKLRLHPIRAAALDDLDETITLNADKHWRECVQRMRDASDVCAETPSTLLTELRDYQREGFEWLARLAQWGVGACLADDMGLGKTIQALALLLLRSADGPALVVAPTSVAFNWQNEIVRFAPTLNVRLFGAGDREAAMKDLGPRDVVICSYGLLYNEAKRLQSQAWHTVILDEAQAIKNVATKRSQAAMGLDADFRLIMTGTPLENHLGELWNLLQFINPGLLGSPESFQKRFAAPIERDACRETRRRLKKLIQPFILRRTKSQVLEELPSRTEITLKVELSDEEAAFYEALRQHAIEKLAEAEDDRPQHLQILAELMRLRRACCHPRLVMEDSEISSSKLALFSETLDELLESKHKVLVFSQFVDHLTVIREVLDDKGVSYQYLDGSTPVRQRKQRVEAFQSGEGDVFLISLRAGGLGLNLTAADYVIHMDPWWNPAVEDQASDRAHRLGQQRPVTIYRLITKGTIEERITELHAAKRNLADNLLEGTDMTGKLSAAELLRLIRE